MSADQVPAEERRVVTPTRIIPADHGIPTARPMPQAPPGTTDLPPWRTAAPTPAPAVPPPPPPPPPMPAIVVPVPQGPIEVLVTLQPPEHEPTRWQRLTAWLGQFGRPWQAAGALTLALLPIPGVGYSIATTWASAVSGMRAEWGQQAGYALALTPLSWALLRIYYHGGTIRRLLVLAVSVVGMAGAIHLYDPVTWITGVHAS
ncbi:hypothetical protein OG978_32660 [Streptomyces sp. NBC_01591]|uniref:hypothetical protein n=1 Tax=Streptomyces sp. NBC_01591 TaxID=2975888 RepID=UPI002DDB6705|nr:hypothetical protein [Streptomyces sp. NBC_01591]WSD71726.1 hypothetical protein OG978_32660 [Streptomyces sp. NBC_01591]